MSRPVTEEPKPFFSPDLMPGGKGRNWEKPIFTGCSGCRQCCHDCCCVCCMACDVAHSLGEYCCVWFCSGISALRMKARLAMGIKGSATGDYLITSASMATTTPCCFAPMCPTSCFGNYPLCIGCPSACMSNNLDIWTISQIWHELKQANLLVERGCCECPCDSKKECMCA